MGCRFMQSPGSDKAEDLACLSISSGTGQAFVLRLLLQGWSYLSYPAPSAGYQAEWPCSCAAESGEVGLTGCTSAEQQYIS
jgi:hypothetical protein